MADLIRAAVDRGLSGLEHYVGIPSTVGGAVWQNLHFLSPAPARERTMFIEEVTAERRAADRRPAHESPCPDPRCSSATTPAVCTIRAKSRSP